MLIIALIGSCSWIENAINRDPFASVYAENCAVCHGKNMEGGAQGPALVGAQLIHGESIPELTRSIAEGFPESGMPSWSGTMKTGRIKSLAILIAETGKL